MWKHYRCWRAKIESIFAQGNQEEARNKAKKISEDNKDKFAELLIVKDFKDMQKLEKLQIRGLNQIGLQGIKTEEEESSLEHKIEGFMICDSDYEEN